LVLFFMSRAKINDLFGKSPRNRRYHYGNGAKERLLPKMHKLGKQEAI